MRYFTALLLAVLFQQSPAPARADGIDLKALESLLATQKLKLSDVGFDFDYFNAMPEAAIAHHAAPASDKGQTKLFRSVQKDPLAFPDRMHDVARTCATFTDWHDLMMMIADILGQPVTKPSEPTPVDIDVSKLPEKLRAPVARVAAACFGALTEADKIKMTATLMRTIEATRPEFAAFAASDGATKLNVVIPTKHGNIVVRAGGDAAKYLDPSALLWIDLGGDDDYEGQFAYGSSMHPVRVVLDFAGNDTYSSHENAQGCGQQGLGILCDFAGNDRYTVDTKYGQGAGVAGIGILYDAAGDDTYSGKEACQGAAAPGIGILLDRAGRDTYESATQSQAFASTNSVGLLIDLEGNDDYLARDPMNGHGLVTPAPQDPSHNISMCQGAVQGVNNPQGMQAGGVALLVDAKGNDRYRAGCWAQGVGYFCGVGALCDFEGDDTYSAWVYAMGSGAHGGAGLLSDRAGNDVYKVGGWNALGMAVDFGIGMALDGAGNDDYRGVTSGLGWSTGLAIAIFQDAGGDDTYHARDDKLGTGRFYENEDYNNDGKITPAEKRHWGFFLDLGGLDRYSTQVKNATNWSAADYSGGIDVASVKPSWNVPDNWQDLSAEEVFKLGASAASKDRVAFALEHGLQRAAIENVADAEALIGKDVVDLYKKAATTQSFEELIASHAALPEDRRALARSFMKSALLARLDAWVVSLKPLLDKRATIDQARTAVFEKDVEKRRAALAKVRELWADREKDPVVVDPAMRALAAVFDAFDRGWRDRTPVAGANLSLASLTVETVAFSPTERMLLDKSRAVLGRKVSDEVALLNELRATMGRPRIPPHAELMTLSEDIAKAKGQGEPVPGVGFMCVEAKSFEAALDGWIAGVELEPLMETVWANIGIGQADGWIAIALGISK